MSREWRFKRYRDQAELERDASRMAVEGWRLRGWRVRGKTSDLQGPPPAMEMQEYASLGPWGCGYAVFESLRALMWLVAWMFAAPWVLLRGRKRIEAAYERGGEDLQ